MNNFHLICTHNPQDFYNGTEPYGYTRHYDTSNLVQDVSRELSSGCHVIVLPPKKEAKPP